MSFSFIASALLSYNKTSYEELWKTACVPFRLQSFNVTSKRDWIWMRNRHNLFKSLFFNRVSFQFFVVRWWCTKNVKFVCCLVFNEAMKSKMLFKEIAPIKLYVYYVLCTVEYVENQIKLIKFSFRSHQWFGICMHVCVYIRVGPSSKVFASRFFSNDMDTKATQTTIT